MATKKKTDESESSEPKTPPAAGDTVQLKSGGPVMTLGTVAGDNGTVHWFDGNDEIQSATFPLAALEVETSDDE